jgi:hypothetical protein
LTGRRDFDKAKQLVEEAGYKVLARKPWPASATAPAVMPNSRRVIALAIVFLSPCC